MNKIALLLPISALLICSCYLNAFYFQGNAQIYNDSSYEIRIVYERLGVEYLRVYLVPKEEDTCDAYITEMNATLIIKSDSSLTKLRFKSRSDTSTYDLSNKGIKLIIKDKNNVFGTYYMGGHCPDAWGDNSKSVFAYCMVNLYLLDTNNMYKLKIKEKDTIEYEISGKIQVHNNKLIEINNKGIMQPGDYNGRYTNKK
jgi:hypothetical protein